MKETFKDQNLEIHITGNLIVIFQDDKAVLLQPVIDFDDTACFVRSEMNIEDYRKIEDFIFARP